MTASVSDVISAITLFILGVTALGFIIAYPFFRRQNISKSLFGNFIVGILSFYTLVLCQVKLSFFSVLFPVFILVGGVLFTWHCWQKKVLKLSTAPKQYLPLLFTLVYISISVWSGRHLIERILFEPVFQWDARVNWFFYAKKFFYADGLNENTHIIFANSITDVHPGYPKIVPVMGAYFATYFGFWNEHLPKLSLLVLYAGVIIGLYSAKPIHWAWKAILLILLIGFTPYMQSTANNTHFLSIGYMDGWMAIYAFLSVLFFTLYIRKFEKEYLFNGVVTALFLANIKNEGLPIALLIIMIYVSIIVLFNFKNRRFLIANGKRFLQFMPTSAALIMPLIVWGNHKKNLKIESADNVDLSPLLHVSSYPQTFTSVKLDLINKSFLSLTFSPNFWYVYCFILIGAIIYLRLQQVSRRNQAYFLSEYAFTTACGLAVITLMVVTFWVLPDKLLTPYIVTGADRLALHSYYITGVCIFCCATTFYYIPFSRKHPVATKISGQSKQVYSPTFLPSDSDVKQTKSLKKKRKQ